MSLLPPSARIDIPKLYETESQPDPLVRAKLFTTWTHWTWYIIEFDGDDLCFGLVDGYERELGYFSMHELESIRGPGGLKIVRDEHFKAVPLSKLQEKLQTTGVHPRLPYWDRER